MISEGEFIYLYNDKCTFMIPYKDKSSISTHKGDIKLTGELNFGDIVYTNIGEPFYILKPTLADYMMKVKRSTTIIYPKEAGTLVLEMGIRTGTRMIEIGSGSGSFTLLLSNLVGPTGKIYSYERREDHQERAKSNLKRFGFGQNVEFILSDPSVDGGFGITDMDAVFLDVPAPWFLVGHAYEALSGGGHIGSLSPNIEQVQATAEKMEEIGFVRIRCMEILSRGIRIKKNLTRPFDRMIGHTGYLLFAQKANSKIRPNLADYSI